MSVEPRSARSGGNSIAYACKVRRCWLVAATAVLGLAFGCSEPPKPPASSSATTRPSFPSPAGTPTRVSPSPTPRQTYSMPLALIVHAARPAADVPVGKARRVIADGGTRWPDIGQPGGRMRVVSTKNRSAKSVIQAVRGSDEVLGLLPAEAVDPTVRVLTVGGRHPLRDPKGYPLKTAWARRVPEVTTLAAVGDIMLGRRVGSRHFEDPAAPLQPLSRRLAAAEITVGNFESTLSADGSPTQGSDSFSASPRVVPGLRTAGFDVISLANNHVGDYGTRALRQTLSRFDVAGIKTVGAGRNLTAARRPVIIER